MAIKTPDVTTIVEIGLKYPEIGNAEITRLFGTSRPVTTRLKTKVREVMAERGVRTWNAHSVNTKIAFEVWGLNLDDAMQSVKQLKRLGLGGDS